MDREIRALLSRLRALEEEWERKAEARQAEFRYRMERRRVVFEQAIAERHREVRTGMMRFLRESPLSALFTAPVLYALAVPLGFLDLAVNLYQWICFPAWGVPRVRRGDYLVIDRHYLGYLNPVQKLNCIYCGYATGMIAFAREVAGRTEQYWCPVKHAARTQGAHDRYRDFLEYGDAGDFEARAEALRQKLRDQK